MRNALIALSMLLGTTNPAFGQVSVGISVPGVSIGIHQPVYPQLVLVPGYPVYYAPHMSANYFFYDGMYWVYYDDTWYASSWYNGPWYVVSPYYVPLFVLRVPVRYYRAPPVYFRGWHVDAPPRWDRHWGPRWVEQRRGWDKWNRSAAPKPAPLPVYQRQYSGDRYPRAEQQQALRAKHYRYEPREAVVRQRLQEQARQSRPEARQQAPEPQRGKAETRAQPSQRERDNDQRTAPPRAVPQREAPAFQEQRQQPRQAQPRGPQGKGEPQQSRGNPERRQGPPGPDRGKDEDKGQGRP
jgi:hypothetical protein